MAAASSRSSTQTSTALAGLGGLHLFEHAADKAGRRARTLVRCLGWPLSV